MTTYVLNVGPISAHHTRLLQEHGWIYDHGWNCWTLESASKPMVPEGILGYMLSTR